MVLLHGVSSPLAVEDRRKKQGLLLPLNADQLIYYHWFSLFSISVFSLISDFQLLHEWFIKFNMFCCYSVLQWIFQSYLVFGTRLVQSVVIWECHACFVCSIQYFNFQLSVLILMFHGCFSALSCSVLCFSVFFH